MEQRIEDMLKMHLFWWNAVYPSDTAPTTVANSPATTNQPQGSWAGNNQPAPNTMTPQQIQSLIAQQVTQTVQKILAQTCRGTPQGGGCQPVGKTKQTGGGQGNQVGKGNGGKQSGKGKQGQGNGGQQNAGAAADGIPASIIAGVANYYKPNVHIMQWNTAGTSKYCLRYFAGNCKSTNCTDMHRCPILKPNGEVCGLKEHNHFPWQCWNNC